MVRFVLSSHKGVAVAIRRRIAAAAADLVSLEARLGTLMARGRHNTVWSAITAQVQCQCHHTWYHHSFGSLPVYLRPLLCPNSASKCQQPWAAMPSTWPTWAVCCVPCFDDHDCRQQRAASPTSLSSLAFCLFVVPNADNQIPLFCPGTCELRQAEAWPRQQQLSDVSVIVMRLCAVCLDLLSAAFVLTSAFGVWVVV